jgi:3-oxoadipate enol-lactonase
VGPAHRDGARKWHGGGGRRTIDRWFTAPGRARLAKAVQGVRAMILATPVEGFCGCCAAIRDMDERESIRTITTPTQVVVGEQDPSTTVDSARFIHERIAGSELVVIPDAAHLCNIEQSAAFNETLIGFLARV